jgi:LmbE family N-acetylglucosaminyl deacetylase
MRISLMTMRRARELRGVAALAAIGIGGWLALPLAASLPQDQGAAGTWQKILKLGTTASAMHTTAHPDDEHGGMLALLSRRDGARVSLLTLNRGESGDNAIGPQLFDGLGLIRTEELLVSNRYYGVDDQYFSTVTDYGFSKRIDEAFDKWGKDNVMRDVVRIIRMNRPLVLISRFQGSLRDGHGNHQTAGLITTEAFKMAGDPNAFPEQIKEGLRPWQPLKVYIGGMREEEDWHVKVDAGEYSPWIGDSYGTFARTGLSFQRSQTSGRFNPQAGPSPGYYKRAGSILEGQAREQGFFDGIDTTLPGLFRALRRPEPPGAAELLGAVDRAVKDAAAAFTMTDPAAAVPALARGLSATRDAIARFGGEPDAVFVLQVKERQFQDAINAALGVDFTALAQPAGVPEPTGMMAMFAPPPAMTAPVPGSTFEVRTRLTNRSRVDIAPTEIVLDAARGWTVEKGQGSVTPLKYNQSASQRFTVSLGQDVALSTKTYFSRPSILENRYRVEDVTQFGKPAGDAPAVAVARYTVAGVPVEVRRVVSRREPKLPYGDVLRELRVVPALALTVAPTTAVIPLRAAVKQVTVNVGLLNNHEGAISGQLALRLPARWKSDPVSHAFSFARAGERSAYTFKVLVPSVEDRAYTIEAIATAGGREYREGYEVIDQRDLEVRYLYRAATMDVKGLDVNVVPNLHVGYVMGVGDQNPAGIAQLGYKVTLLTEGDLATANLRQFDAIVTGTRAYAVREDLKTYNRRLLDYVQQGGNLVVLYNTAEFQPNRFAPYPAELTQRAEEVSEEDSPVDVLAPTHQAFNWPNKITKADFDGWVEQRGSKFWSGWDKTYTPMLASWDRGQEPQKGGWVWTRYGKGHYTYFAYAFHRQLPYGVPGAYRLLANVLALGKAPARPARPAAAQ